MNNEIYLIGEVGWEITPENVIKEIQKSDPKKPLNIHIHSQGGNVYDGLAIYNYLKKLDQEVNTISMGLVASIASIIFLAGRKETRVVNKTDSFLIHLPSNMAYGNAEDLEKRAEELRKIENQLAEIYENETDLTQAEAMDLMKKDEFMDVEFLKEKGFVNNIVEFKAVAKFNKQSDMKPETKEDNMTPEKMEGILAKFYNKFFGKTVENYKMQTATGETVDFPNVPENETPQVGAEAEMNGDKAEGEILMPTGEKYIFTNGKLESITEAPADPDNKILTDLKAEIETLKATITERETAIETAATEATALNAKIDEIKTSFNTLKTEVTGNFDYTGKKKKESEGAPTSRKLFKEE